MPVPKVKGKERSRTRQGRWRKKRSDSAERINLEFLEARKKDIEDKIRGLENDLTIINVLIERNLTKGE